MSYTDLDRTLALAGIFQAASLTAQLARTGSTDSAAYNASLHSLFIQNPSDVADVFGGSSGVAFGLKSLIQQLDNPKRRDTELSQYAIGIIQLAIQLAKDPERQAALGQDISDLDDRRKAFDMADTQLFAPLADHYQRHISTLSPRIMVKGEPLHLQNPDTAARIRCALLAGVRAAHLWQQCGGSRWHLIFKRKRLVESAEMLLKQGN